MNLSGSTDAHVISIVIPVYKGELTLDAVVNEIAEFTSEATSPGGARWIVAEVLLVFDNGPDDSARVIRELQARHEFVRAVWLSRNFGQHSATLAGMASTGSEWVVTMDEDGQHNPTDIGVLIDSALANKAPLVYAKPTNPPPHGVLRNAASRWAKRIIAGIASDRSATDYQSFRLVLGETGRSVAAYVGAGVYLDVALGWVAARSATAEVRFRQEGPRGSGYSTRKLVSHFWRLVLSSGTRPLRFVAGLGAVFAGLGLLLSIVFVVQRIAGSDLPAGWTSLVTVVLLSSGAVLFSLGVIAEYLGMVVNMALGKPPYLISADPGSGPLERSEKHP